MTIVAGMAAVLGVSALAQQAPAYLAPRFPGTQIPFRSGFCVPGKRGARYAGACWANADTPSTAAIPATIVIRLPVSTGSHTIIGYRSLHMPYAPTQDGIRLYYEETGAGRPVIFVHEFAGDLRSWEPQLRHFGQRYRCVAFNARGYPPSDVPESAAAYSQALAADDIQAVLNHLAIDKAHIVGLSMGGFATLHFGFRHPQRALSLCVAGCGYGAEPAQRARFQAEAETIAA